MKSSVGWWCNLVFFACCAANAAGVLWYGCHSAPGGQSGAESAFSVVVLRSKIQEIWSQM